MDRARKSAVKKALDWMLVCCLAIVLCALVEACAVVLWAPEVWL